ncbi:MAG: hypothetical protein IKX10_02020 [Lachnospiraceae bacterium]|nr:hypothetical protein [Lachnospiraceae bacterium]
MVSDPEAEFEEKLLTLGEDADEAENEEEIPGLVNDNRGIGVIEMVLILVVLVGLVLIFKNQLNSIISDVFDKVNSTINRL